MSLFYGMAVHRNTDLTGTEPLDFRKDLGALVSRVGVLPGSASPVVAGTAGWAYSVRGPSWWVTQWAAGDGFQVWGNDGDVTVGETGVGGTVPAAPAAGLERWDVVWVRHPSNGEAGSTSSAPEVGVTVGTAASSATVPAIPTGALELARNLMTSAAATTASGGNTLSHTVPFSSLRGGFVVVRNTTERDVLLAIASAANPVLVFLQTEGGFQVCKNGSTWQNVGGFGELNYDVAVTTGARTSSTNIANRGITDVAATFDRVVEFVGIVNNSGITAGSAWQAVVTSSGAVVTTNVVASARLSFTATVAVGGSATVAGWFDLPAGTTCNPRLWVELLAAGTVTITASSFKYRIRAKG